MNLKIEKQQLLELINEYRAAVKKAVNLLNAKSEKDKGFQFERTGYLDAMKKSSYGFHGIGCLVTTEEFKVDFDFGEGGRCDGIDPGFLQHFIRYNKDVKHSYSNFDSFELIVHLLQDLEGDGLVTKNLAAFLGRPVELYNDRIFYLISAIHDPDAPVWKPYWPEDADFDYKYL